MIDNKGRLKLASREPIEHMSMQQMQLSMETIRRKPLIDESIFPFVFLLSVMFVCLYCVAKSLQEQIYH